MKMNIHKIFFDLLLMISTIISTKSIQKNLLMYKYKQLTCFWHGLKKVYAIY